MDLAEADLRCAARFAERDAKRPLGPSRANASSDGAQETRCSSAPTRTACGTLISNFVSFAFCKAHAVTYGRIAYRAALAQGTPSRPLYMAAFLASETGYYADARLRRGGAPTGGRRSCRPDINRSAPEFLLEDDSLRVGLDRVRGLTQATLERILKERERTPFLSLPDFLERSGARTDETEHLIQAGAFDSFDRTRPELAWRLHLLRTAEQRVPRDVYAIDRSQLAACRATLRSRETDAVRRAQQSTGGWGSSSKGLGLGGARLKKGESASLFPEPETPALVLPGLPDLDETTRGQIELGLLGLTISKHPVELYPCPGQDSFASAFAKRRGHAHRAKAPRQIGCGQLDNCAGQAVALVGWLAATRRVRTANGKWMRFLTLEDRTGIAEVVLFPEIYTAFGHKLISKGPFCISGLAEDQMGACTLHAERIW